MQKPKSREEATGRIKILKTPAGQAPQEIREAWVGLILPCYPQSGIPAGEVRGAVTGEKVAKRQSVIVPQDQAIAILEQHSAKAAAWWKALGFPMEGQGFVFGADEVGIVSGVTEVPMDVFDDLDTGHWEEMPLGAGGR